MIQIISNGSKWAGEQPDTVEKLIEVLGEQPLNPTFEGYGNFIIEENTDLVKHGVSVRVRFFGNFARLSHVFNIRTDEPDLIATLTKAIRDNQATSAYQLVRAGYHPCGKCGKLAQFCRCEKKLPARPVNRFAPPVNRGVPTHADHQR
jgi:hypothetical protein